MLNNKKGGVGTWILIILILVLLIKVLPLIEKGIDVIEEFKEEGISLGLDGEDYDIDTIKQLWESRAVDGNEISNGEIE